MKLPAISRSRRAILFAALALAVLLGVFGFFADEVIEGDTVVFDTAVTMVLRDNGDIMNPIGPAWFEEAGRDVTSPGSFSILGLIVILVLTILVLIKRPFAAAYVTFAVLSGTVLSSVFKQIYDRPRPPMLEAMRVFTSSFPSGHATVSAVVYLTLAALLAPLCIAAGIFLTLLVGVSRVYLGVHYPTDMIAGWSLGAAWALLCWVGANLLGTWLHMFVSKVTIGKDRVRICGPKDQLLKAVSEDEVPARAMVPTFAREWRALRDSNS